MESNLGLQSYDVGHRLVGRLLDYFLTGLRNLTASQKFLTYSKMTLCMCRTIAVAIVLGYLSRECMWRATCLPCVQGMNSTCARASRFVI